MEQYATVTEASRRIILPHVLPVKVMAPSGSSLTTYTLLDNAPRGTFICRAIANSMGLKGQGQLVSGNTVVEKTDEEFSLQ